MRDERKFMTEYCLRSKKIFHLISIYLDPTAQALPALLALIEHQRLNLYNRGGGGGGSYKLTVLENLG